MIYQVTEDSGIKRTYYHPDDLYSIIFAITHDEYEAIMVSGWAETADADQEYWGDGFSVTAER